MKITSSSLVVLAIFFNLPQSSAIPVGLDITSLPTDTAAINKITPISIISTLNLTQIITLGNTIYETILPTTTTVIEPSPTTNSLSDWTVINSQALGQLKAEAHGFGAITDLMFAFLGLLAAALRGGC